MNKKYKIEFPKELCSVIDQKLLKFNHCVVYDSGVWNQDDEMFFNGDGNGKYIPRKYLKEVEEFKEWKKQREKEFPCISLDDNLDGTLWTDEDLLSCYEWTVENEKKKHEPERSFGECADEYLQNSQDFISRYEIFELGWKAYAKNRRYDD
jgi:hypothetical protein